MENTHSGPAASHEPASEQVKPELLVLTERQIKNFWAKVDKAGPIPLQRPELGACWLWTGGMIKGGYGRVRIGERLYLAHRVSHGISKFKIPDDKLGCHECDNPRCVNDAHIFVGTHADNAMDKSIKGRCTPCPGDKNGARIHIDRMPRGDRNGMRTKPESVLRGERCVTSKLKTSDILSIRARYAAGGITQAQLASDYGIAQAHVSTIVLGKAWRHLLISEPRSCESAD